MRVHNIEICADAKQKFVDYEKQVSKNNGAQLAAKGKSISTAIIEEREME